MNSEQTTLKRESQHRKPTQGELLAMLDYNPETGVFLWKTRQSQRSKPGESAGYLSRGYLNITIRNKEYKAHRLAWLMMTGNWPVNDVDHRDRNRSNNAWVNLREATRMENTWNAPVSKNNLTGAKGVALNQKKQLYEVRITTHGKTLYLGSSRVLEKARRIYDEAAQRLCGPFFYKQTTKQPSL